MGRLSSFAGEVNRSVDHSLNFIKEDPRRVSMERITAVSMVHPKRTWFLMIQLFEQPTVR